MAGASHVVVLGKESVGRRVCGQLQASGVRVHHLGEPSDIELREALTADVEGIAVMLHDDIKGLRYSLAAHRILPAARLFVAMFDRTAREQLRSVVPDSVVLSPAAIAVPSLIAAAIAPQANAVRRRGQHDEKEWVTVASTESDSVAISPYEVPRGLRRAGLLGRMSGQLRPHDAGTKVLLAGVVGLIGVITVDTVVGLTHASLVRALYDATRTTATISAPDLPDEIGILLWATFAALSVLTLTAMFSAGIVHYLLSGKHVALIGRRVVPRRGHVIVAGLGQVGLRLAEELQELGVAVAGVEVSPTARTLQLAKARGIPVVIGDAASRATLRSARLRHAKALIAAGSEEWDNIAVAVSALAVAPNTRLVIRAGTGDAIDETRSLFAIGAVVDVNGLTSSFVATSMTHKAPYAVVAVPDFDLAVASTGEIIDQRAANTPRCACR